MISDEEKAKARELFECGILKLREPDLNREEQREAVLLIIEASKLGDPDALYFVGAKTIAGEITLTNENPTEHALRLLKLSANAGNMNARIFLNRYCSDKDKNRVIEKAQFGTEGPLKDFDGKEIRICETGEKTPVDAVLKYENGVNTLTLSLNVYFVDLFSELGEMKDTFERSVLAGIRSWGGSYEVFGGQKLNVDVRVEVTSQMNDTVDIIYVGKKMRKAIKFVSKINPNRKSRKLFVDNLNKNRSFSISGVEWSVNSKKNIYLTLSDEKLHSEYETECIARHEFGHVLGLGDLYCEPGRIDGVEKGKYSELESYMIFDKCYNLVMDDCHGVISNNDIEMVVLAFSENRMQLYQPLTGYGGQVSKALGKGN